MNHDFDSDAEVVAASMEDDRASVQELDSVGAKTIELYQNHLALTDRIWVYFSQYSALIFILACGLAFAHKSVAVVSLPRVLLALPLVVYLLLSIGNTRTLALTLEELQIVKNIAQTKTRFVFRSTPPHLIQLFQRLLMILVALTYVAAWALVELSRVPPTSQPVR